MTDPIVVADNVHKWYGDRAVLRGISLTVAPGEVVCLMGPSGAGKTTFLRCINSLESYEAGRLYCNGELVGYRESDGALHHVRDEVLQKQRQSVGMVFQDFNLFSHMTALENIIEGPRIVQKRERRQCIDEARKLLARVGLSDKADAYPNQMSGGQQQRVAIARAVAMHPSVILFDEPTSSLDPELVGEVLDVMRELAHEGITMIVVTHEVGFARDVANTIVFMDGGRVVEVGAPADLLLHPKEERTRDFLRSVV